MHYVEQAKLIISAVQSNWGVERISLGEAHYRTLAQDIIADRDFPSFDRAMMDGFAIRYSDWQKGQRIFHYSHQQWAGSPLIKLSKDESCEITTGAAVPENFDVVIPIEKVNMNEPGCFTLNEIDSIKPFWNIQKKGVEQTQGDVLFHRGKAINPAIVAVLASCGITHPEVYTLPKIAIVSTGDELVDINEIPLEHQIRSSNVHAIASLVSPYSNDIQKFHLKDNEQEIEQWMIDNENLFDIILFSGGVSKGGKDYLPMIWEKRKFIKRIHGIFQKPGKPMWFGNKGKTVLFGFPGNPVSSLTCAIVYLIPWIQEQLHIQNESLYISINEKLMPHEKLDLWIPVVRKNNGYQVLTYKGSGDLVGFSQLDGIVHCPKISSTNNIQINHRYYPITR